MVEEKRIRERRRGVSERRRAEPLWLYYVCVCVCVCVCAALSRPALCFCCWDVLLALSRRLGLMRAW